MLAPSLLLLACGGPPTADLAPPPPPVEAEPDPGAAHAVESERQIRAFTEGEGWTVDACDRTHDETGQTWCDATRGDQAGTFIIAYTKYGISSDIAHRKVEDATFEVLVWDLAASDQLLDALIEAGVADAAGLDPVLAAQGWTVVPDPNGLSAHGHGQRGEQWAFARFMGRSSAPAGTRARDGSTSTAVIGQQELVVSVDDRAASREILDRWVPPQAP